MKSREYVLIFLVFLLIGLLIGSIVQSRQLVKLIKDQTSTLQLQMETIRGQKALIEKYEGRYE